MNIRIKGKDQDKVELLSRLFLQKPEGNIDLLLKGKSFYRDISSIEISGFLNYIVSLENENKELRTQINTITSKRQDLEKNAKIIQLIGLLRDTNSLPYQSIADKLNQQGFTNSRGNQFTKLQVSRLYKKYNLLKV